LGKAGGGKADDPSSLFDDYNENTKNTEEQTTF